MEQYVNTHKKVHLLNELLHTLDDVLVELEEKEKKNNSDSCKTPRNSKTRENSSFGKEQDK